MIAYHWSPRENQKSIREHGLLVPTKHPKLVVPVTCSQNHRNPHVSLGKTVFDAWELSGGFLARREREEGFIPEYSMPINRLWWDLWQVDLGIDNSKYPRGIRYRVYGREIQVARDIPRSRIRYGGERCVRDV